MKLQQLQPDPEQNQNIIRDIEFFLQQPSCKELRPCAGCNIPCPCCHSATCTCACRPNCDFAPMAMSSDPNRYPIEVKIVSLVFSFNCLRVCQPYWSCEGHTFTNGEIHRVPQVWFYSRSMIYPKLIGDYVFNLWASKTIAHPWHVCLSFSENSLETGFSIEPDVKLIDKPDLEIMQIDANLIANNLADGLKVLALKYLDNFKASKNKP